MNNNPGLSGVSADGNRTWSISHPARVGPPMPDHGWTVTRTYTSCEVDMTPAEIAQQENALAREQAANATAAAAQLEAVVADSAQNEQYDYKGEKEEK